MLNKSILVIESEQDMLHLLQDKLQDHLIQALLHHDAARIMDVAGDRDLDLILLHADALSGELVSLVRDLRNRLPVVPIMAAIHQIDTDLLVEAVNSGIARVCRLPVKTDELIQAITETISARELSRDITRSKTLIPVYDLGRKFISATSETAIYEELVCTVARELKVARVSVLLFRENENLLRLVAQQGLDQQYVQNLTIKPGERIAGKVFQTQAPLILNRGQDTPSPYRELMLRKELAAAICFPFASREKSVLGILNIGETREGKEFCEADVDLLNIITGQAIMAVENLRHVLQREEQKRVRQSLEQYISPEVSDLLLARNDTEQLLEIGGTKDLTILFADIRNFTILAQELPLDKLRYFLNNFFEIFSKAVFAGQGMLDKFMGDAVLAVFGAPIRQENPCCSAAVAACNIAREFRLLRKKWESEYSVFSQIALGIGMSRGPLFLGNVGSAERLDYTVLGLDVNIAQRLASEPNSGFVYVTKSVFDSLDERFAVLEEITKKLRGVHNPQLIYSITLKNDLTRTRSCF